MEEFERNPAWTKDTLSEVAQKTGLSEGQVYKWGWDQKRKKYGPDSVLLVDEPKGRAFNFEEHNQDFMSESTLQDGEDSQVTFYEDEVMKLKRPRNLKMPSTQITSPKSSRISHDSMPALQRASSQLNAQL